MSKRLHASLRASNKGRNLRPRSSQVPGDRASDLPEADAPAQEAEGAKAAAVETVKEAAKEAAAELVKAARAESVPPAKAESIPPAKAQSIPPAEARESVPPAKIASVTSVASVASDPVNETLREPGVARGARVVSDVPPASKVEPPETAPTLPSSFSKREEPKAEPVKVEVVKAEPVKADALKPEAAKAEPPKVERVEKAAQAVASAKLDDRSKGQAKVDPKKVTASAKVDDKRSKRPEQAKADRGRKPASDDDDVDASSISAEFFRKDQDSVPPIEEHHDRDRDDLDDLDDEHAILALSPSTLARRARFRRLVAGVVAFAGVVSLAVVGKAVMTKPRPAPVPAAAVAEIKHEPVTPAPSVAAIAAVAATGAPAAQPPATSASAEPEAKVDAPKTDDTAKPDSSAKPDTSASAKPDSSAKPEDAKPDGSAKPEDKPAAPSGGDPKALKKEVEALLNRGKNKDAVGKARELIAADPSDASGYLYLGAALQETGHWKDGIDAFCDCVRNATKGPISDCRLSGGHK